MATPHVSGAVAFAAMNFPAETVAQRVERILKNVDIKAGLQGVVRTGGRLNLLRTVDTDGNGLPDWWELQFFGRLTGANSIGDFDYDGASDLAEWVAGTNPTNADSCLRVFAPATNSTFGCTIQWPGVAGKSYRLERATDLAVGFTSIVRTHIPATPPFNTEIDAAVLPESARYYRVSVEQ